MIKNVFYTIKVIIVTWLIRFFYKTNHWNIQGLEQIDELLKEGRSIIVASWHGQLLPTFMNLAKYGYYGLAGMHKDAELISQFGERIGWKLLRGSSSDRGKEVYLEMVKVLETPGSVVALTPDGPKGPARIPKPGVIRAAQKTGAVIIPAMGQSTKHWGFTNWDTFYIAKPFGRIEMIYGEPLYFSEDDDFKSCAETLRETLNALAETVDNSVKT